MISIPCGLCFEPTLNIFTKRCDRCWDLENMIDQNLSLAARIVELRLKERFEIESNGIKAAQTAGLAALKE